MIQRNHSSTEILKVFGDLEVGGESPAGGRKFRKSGNWLIAESFLDELIAGFFFRRKVVRPPGFRLAPTWRGIGVLLYRRLFAKSLLGSSCADAIYVKSNARAFYLEEPRKTIKLGLESTARALTSLRNEIEVREQLAQLGFDLVPLMDSSYSKEAPCFLTEELVLGRRCRVDDETQLFVQLMHSLSEMHRVYGVFLRRVEDVMASDTVERVEKSLAELDWKEQWIPKSEVLSFASEILLGGEVVPCSLTHGDLSLGNMLLDEQGRVYLVDWESSKEQPVMCDFYRLLGSVPEVEVELRSLMARERYGNNSMSFEKQLALMYLSLLARYSEVASKRKIRERVEEKVKKLMGLIPLAH